MASFIPTPITLLSQLRDSQGGTHWQISWKRFLELYHAPLSAVAHACYRKHTNGLEPGHTFIEDIVATVVADFFARSQHRYDPDKGRLRDFLRTIVNARVVDLLRKQRPFEQLRITDLESDQSPVVSPAETEAFNRALLATLVEDLRGKIPLRQFEIFELVKLKDLSPQSVADDLGLSRERIDREIYKAMIKLRELAKSLEYQEEFYS